MPRRSLTTATLVVLSALTLAAACGGEYDELEDLDEEDPFAAGPESAVRRSAVVDVDGEPVHLEIDDFDGVYVLEGDIVLDPDLVTFDDEPAGAHTQGLSAVGKRRLWPNGIVYYRLSTNLSATMRQRVLKAMAAWEAKTVIRFKKAGPARSDYVLIRPSSGNVCVANVGRTGTKQRIWLSNACTTGAIKHELGHAMGLWHEQSRTDRDEHVEVLWHNIRPGYEGNFRKYLPDSKAQRDVGPYTLRSLMHYGSWTLSRNGKPTMVRRSDHTTFGGNRTKIHANDAAGVNGIYAAVMN